MTAGLFQDSPVMVIVDLMILINIVASSSFLIKFMTQTRFESSTMGRLIVANQVGWLVISIGGLLFRMHLPEPAGWLLLPIALGVPAVTIWWHAVLGDSLRTKDKLSTLLDEWHATGKMAAAAGRQDEALILIQNAQQLARAINAPSIRKCARPLE